jgi:uncharacterized zinc-type alcohol dehydrogenase-like protein
MIKGYVAKSAHAKLELFEYEPKPLGTDDVEISISHCGVCHSDLHLINNDWGFSRYPFIPGHELVGLVTQVGDHVKHLQTGDRVGVGWQRGACMTCELCMSGRHNLCAQSQATCVGNHGGFATGIRVDSRFAVKIPSGLKSENAGPLFCAGVTSFSPFLTHEVRATHRVGIVGIGGLGHLAVKFARAFGCEVTCFSSSPDKADEALSMGAHNFVSSKDKKEMSKFQSRLDFIISTANADLDWESFLATLRPNGKLCFVGVPPNPIKIPVMNIIESKSVSASPIGSPVEIAIMLEFCERHHIEAMTEVVPMSQVNEAMKRVAENKVRYRMVLKA